MAISRGPSQLIAIASASILATHSIVLSIVLAKMGKLVHFILKAFQKVQFTEKMRMARLLSWQISTNFQMFLDMFQLNKRQRCWASRINACTAILISDVSPPTSPAVCSFSQRKTSGNSNSILLDVGARFPHVGVCIIPEPTCLPMGLR